MKDHEGGFLCQECGRKSQDIGWLLAQECPKALQKPGPATQKEPEPMQKPQATQQEAEPKPATLPDDAAELLQLQEQLAELCLLEELEGQLVLLQKLEIAQAEEDAKLRGKAVCPEIIHNVCGLAAHAWRRTCYKWGGML